MAEIEIQAPRLGVAATYRHPHYKQPGMRRCRPGPSRTFLCVILGQGHGSVTHLDVRLAKRDDRQDGLVSLRANVLCIDGKFILGAIH